MSIPTLHSANTYFQRYADYFPGMAICKSQILPWFIHKTVHRRIKKIAAGKHPIVIGPWVSEVGFEILYWIPFVNWAIAHYGLQRERIIVVSRGGVRSWYADVSNKYCDIFDYFATDEFKDKNERRILSTGVQKHYRISSFDKEILRYVCKQYALQKFAWFHPAFMYKLFHAYWGGKRSVKLVTTHTHYRRFSATTSNSKLRAELPLKYVAAKFYFSDCFPDTQQNRSFVTRVLKILSRNNDVVLLSTELNVDDHVDCAMESQNRIYRVSEWITPNNNLDVQSQVMAGASSFCGTYGGFSYLALYYGIPSIAFFSDEDRFLPVHLDIAYRACRALKFDRLDTGDTKKSKDPNHQSPRFLALHVDDLQILNELFFWR